MTTIQTASRTLEKFAKTVGGTFWIEPEFSYDKEHGLGTDTREWIEKAFLYKLMLKNGLVHKTLLAKQGKDNKDKNAFVEVPHKGERILFHASGDPFSIKFGDLGCIGIRVTIPLINIEKKWIHLERRPNPEQDRRGCYMMISDRPEDSPYKEMYIPFRDELLDRLFLPVVTINESLANKFMSNRRVLDTLAVAIEIKELNIVEITFHGNKSEFEVFETLDFHNIDPLIRLLDFSRACCDFFEEHGLLDTDQCIQTSDK